MGLAYEIIKEYLDDEEKIIISSDNIIEEGEIISSNDFCIAVDNPGSGRGKFGSAYFKYYFKRKGKWVVARLIIGKPEFTNTVHSNSQRTGRGKFENVKSATRLSSEESKLLMNILNYPNINKRYSKYGNINVYSAILIEANYNNSISDSNIEKYKNYNIIDCPDYIFPYNMEIPDYTIA